MVVEILLTLYIVGAVFVTCLGLAYWADCWNRLKSPRTSWTVDAEDKIFYARMALCGPIWPLALVLVAVKKVYTACTKGGPVREFIRNVRGEV